jgi:hypothetical protein
MTYRLPQRLLREKAVSVAAGSFEHEPKRLGDGSLNQRAALGAVLTVLEWLVVDKAPANRVGSMTLPASIIRCSTVLMPTPRIGPSICHRGSGFKSRGGELVRRAGVEVRSHNRRRLVASVLATMPQGSLLLMWRCSEGSWVPRDPDLAASPAQTAARYTLARSLGAPTAGSNAFGIPRRSTYGRL